MAHLFIPDIDDNVRAAMIALLNHRLADALDLKLAVKQAHWNIRGPSFIALHLLLDEIAGRVDEHADTMAERIVQIGGAAHGTVQAAASATSLPAYPLDMTAQDGHITALSERLFSFGYSCRKDIEEAANAGDADTADILTGVSRAIDKDLWFLRSHLG